MEANLAHFRRLCILVQSVQAESKMLIMTCVRWRPEIDRGNT